MNPAPWPSPDPCLLTPPCRITRPRACGGKRRVLSTSRVWKGNSTEARSAQVRESSLESTLAVTIPCNASYSLASSPQSISHRCTDKTCLSVSLRVMNADLLQYSWAAFNTELGNYQEFGEVRLRCRRWRHTSIIQKQTVSSLPSVILCVAPLHHQPLPFPNSSGRWSR